MGLLTSLDLRFLTEYAGVQGKPPDIYFQIEAHAPVSDAARDAIEKSLRSCDGPGCYAALWTHAPAMMGKPGFGQALIQAALGMLKADSTLFPHGSPTGPGGFTPIPDILLLSDYESGGSRTSGTTFQIEMKTEISNDCRLAMEECIRNGDSRGCYDTLWRLAPGEMSKPGAGQAVMQAAFGLLPHDPAKFPRPARP